MRIEFFIRDINVTSVEILGFGNEEDGGTVFRTR